MARPVHNFKKATEILNHFYSNYRKGRKSHLIAMKRL